MILVAQHPFPWLARLLPRSRPRPAMPTHRFRLQMRGGASEVVAQPDQGFCVRCERGQLWITHDGDPRDVVLERGQSYTPDNAARMTVHAVEDSALEVSLRT